MSEYYNGIIKANQRMIKFCEDEIQKSKEHFADPNSFQQVRQGAEIKAYNKVIQKAKKNIEKINGHDIS